jgi:hypothetical protein
MNLYLHMVVCVLTCSIRNKRACFLSFFFFYATVIPVEQRRREEAVTQNSLLLLQCCDIVTFFYEQCVNSSRFNSGRCHEATTHSNLNSDWWNQDQVVQRFLPFLTPQPPQKNSHNTVKRHYYVQRSSEFFL